MTHQDLIAILSARAVLAQRYHSRRGGLGSCDRIHSFAQVDAGVLDPELVCRTWDTTAILSASPELKHDPGTLRELLESESESIRRASRRPTMIGVV
jgi:hypothetical protein